MQAKEMRPPALLSPADSLLFSPRDNGVRRSPITRVDQLLCASDEIPGSTPTLEHSGSSPVTPIRVCGAPSDSSSGSLALPQNEFVRLASAPGHDRRQTQDWVADAERMSGIEFAEQAEAPLNPVMLTSQVCDTSVTGAHSQVQPPNTTSVTQPVDFSQSWARQVDEAQPTSETVPTAPTTLGRDRYQVGLSRGFKKYYSNAKPSAHCHCCARTSRSAQFMICSRLREGLCRKVICNKCFLKNGWSWDAALQDNDWLCTHCRNSCPSGGSQCFIYSRVNQRRVKKTDRAVTCRSDLRTVATRDGRFTTPQLPTAPVQSRVSRGDQKHFDH